MLRRRTALWIAAAAGVAVMLLLAFDGLDPLELPARDLALRFLPPRAAETTIIVAIDEQSLRTIGPWPWDRKTLAAIVDRCADAGSRGVILDILLADGRPGDEKLAASSRRLPVLAVAVVDEHGRWLVPGPPLATAMTAAHGNFELDYDGILRRLSTTKQSGDSSLTALSIDAASLKTGAPVSVGFSIAPAFRTPPSSIPTIGASDLLRDAALASRLRGKLVFIGPTAYALGDRVRTPTGSLPDPGVTVHAAATESIIRGDVIRELPPIAAGAFTVVAVGAIVLVRRRRIAAAIVIIGSIAGGMLLLTKGIAIPFVALPASAVLAFAGVETKIIVAALARSEKRYVDHRERDAESKRVLAHELKTPLASMRSLTQLMSGFELTEAERQRVASLLEHEAGKLETMVGTLLDLERLPLRDFASTSAVVDLGDLVAARIRFLRASTDRTLFVSADPEILVRGDAALLERVVDNLVGNALKYTSAPSPVTVRVARNAEVAVFEVEDRGPGIEEADRDRIFQRFVRGETAAGTNGLGLGLSLVAEIARWHGGAAGVDAVTGGGSRFRITLPLVIAQAKAGAM